MSLVYSLCSDISFYNASDNDEVNLTLMDY